MATPSGRDSAEKNLDEAALCHRKRAHYVSGNWLTVVPASLTMGVFPGVAEIVLGLASSHTPQLSTSAAFWKEHAARDERNTRLLGADGRYHSYAELLARADPALPAELDAAVWADKFDRAQAAIEALGRKLAAAEPDVVVIVGDDQHELFGADSVPAIGLFTGESLMDLPPGAERLARIPKDIQRANWAAHADAPDGYPVAAGLSGHLAAALTEREFDVTVMSEQPNGRGLGHAFTFVRRRLHLAAAIPIVPVLLNTYYPPNVPSPGRCWRLGEALRAGLDSWDSGARVAVFASGGLSHFVVQENLDRAVRAGLEQRDAPALGRLPRDLLRSGTSEALNWITAGGALGGLSFSLLDYIPGYRSPAGTGVGMAFATWDRGDR
jgi:3-O-methylgallate 3,4-dioxygenase